MLVNDSNKNLYYLTLITTTQLIKLLKHTYYLNRYSDKSCHICDFIEKFKTIIQRLSPDVYVSNKIRWLIYFDKIDYNNIINIDPTNLKETTEILSAELSDFDCAAASTYRVEPRTDVILRQLQRRPEPAAVSTAKLIEEDELAERELAERELAERQRMGLPERYERRPEPAAVSTAKLIEETAAEPTTESVLTKYELKPEDHTYNLKCFKKIKNKRQITDIVLENHKNISLKKIKVQEQSVFKGRAIYLYYIDNTIDTNTLRLNINQVLEHSTIMFAPNIRADTSEKDYNRYKLYLTKQSYPIRDLMTNPSLITRQSNINNYIEHPNFDIQFLTSEQLLLMLYRVMYVYDTIKQFGLLLDDNEIKIQFIELFITFIKFHFETIIRNNIRWACFIDSKLLDPSLSSFIENDNKVITFLRTKYPKSNKMVIQAIIDSIIDKLTNGSYEINEIDEIYKFIKMNTYSKELNEARKQYEEDKNEDKDKTYESFSYEFIDEYEKEYDKSKAYKDIIEKDEDEEFEEEEEEEDEDKSTETKTEGGSKLNLQQTYLFYSKKYNYF